MSPIYPAAARAKRITGTVAVEVAIDEKGKVIEARAVSGPNLFWKAAETAARRWRFRPARLNGAPQKVNNMIIFNFQLPSAGQARKASTRTKRSGRTTGIRKRQFKHRSFNQVNDNETNVARGKEGNKFLRSLRTVMNGLMDRTRLFRGGLKMYLNYYGLKEIPFSLTPDPKFMFKTESHLEAISTIKYAIEQGKGIAILTGEVGTGKTTTLRAAMQYFSRSVLPCYIFNPYLTVPEFFEQVCAGFGIELPRSVTKTERLNALGRLFISRHSQGLRTALIIDEAHGLSPDVLEEIRLLSNFETSSEKLLQMILSGQPELRENLNRPQLRQLKQRISLRCSLKPLTAFEVNEYIRFRLKVAGAERVNLFDSEAVGIISRVSLGVPRVINNICDNALLYGFSGGHEVIGGEIVYEVIDALDLDSPDLAAVAHSSNQAKVLL